MQPFLCRMKISAPDATARTWFAVPQWLSAAIAPHITELSIKRRLRLHSACGHGRSMENGSARYPAPDFRAGQGAVHDLSALIRVGVVPIGEADPVLLPRG